MPTTLNEDPSQFPATITVPIGGDPRTDVSIQTPFQQLANRTVNTKSRLDAVSPASANGVTVIRHVPTDSALLAIGAADRIDRSLCLVDGIGLYQFLADNATAPLSPWVRQPTDIAAANPLGPGRWVLYPVSALGLANGIPQLDGGARLPAAVVRNGVVAAGSGAGLANFNTSSATLVDVTGTATTLQGLLPGDIVFVDYSAALMADGVGRTTQGVATATRPDGSRAAVTGTSQTIARVQPVPADLASSTLLCAAHGVFSVTSAGAHVFTLQVQAVSGGTAFAANAVLRAWAWRP